MFIIGLFITFVLSSYIYNQYLPYFIDYNECVFMIVAVTSYILIYNYVFIYV